MTTFRAIIDAAVAEAMAEHPKYFTPKGMEHARAVIVRKIMATLRADAKGEAAPASSDDVLPSPPVSTLADPQSREARACRNLRDAAGAVSPPRSGDGRVIINPEALAPAALAFADCPPREAWLFISSPQKICAWSEFFRDTLPGIPKKPIAIVREGQSGILVPWPWPPAKDGKTYSVNEAAA